MSTDAINNKMIPQATQPGASTQATPAAQKTPVEENLFDEKGTSTATADTVNAGQTSAPAEAGNTAGMDTFVPSSNTSAEDINAQMEKIQENNATLKESEASAQNTIDNYSTRVENQENYIDSLNTKNADLNAEITELQNGLNAKYANLNTLDNNINNLEAQIKATEGFVGGFINGFKNATGLFGGGVDVNALKNQLATAKAEKEKLQASIEADETAIVEKGGIVQRNEESIERTEGYKKENEDIIAQQEAELKKIQEMYQNGELTLEQLEAMSEELLKAEAEKKGSTEKPSNEQVKGTTAAVSDILQNGELNTETVEALGNAVASQDTTTGEFDAEVFKPVYEEAGFAPEIIEERIEILEAVATYEEIGIDINIVDLAEMSMTDLDAVVEQAIVQDVIKSTSTKIMGNIKGITSKKDKEALTKTQKEFTTSANILDSYYRANGDKVSDKEVESQVELNNNMISNINQGGVYDTSKLEQVNNKTLSLLTSYQTKVNSSIGIAQDTDTQFLQEKTKTEDILKETETTLGDNAQDNNNYSDSMVEFLNLTTNFNNAETDSEKISCTKLMEELGEKLQRVQDDPDSKNPYVDGSLWIAA